MGINQRNLNATATDAEDPPYVKGNWYIFQETTSQASSAVPANVVRLLPFRVRALVNIAQIGTRISTLVVSGNIQLAVYAAHRDTLSPTGQPIMRTPSLATDTAVPVAAAVIGGPIQIPRGIYWLAINADATAGGTVLVVAPGAASTYQSSLIGAGTQAMLHTTATNAAWLRQVVPSTQPFGTWPDLTPGSGVTSGDTVTSGGVIGHFQIAP